MALVRRHVSNVGNYKVVHFITRRCEQCCGTATATEKTTDNVFDCQMRSLAAGDNAKHNQTIEKNPFNSLMHAFFTQLLA